MKDRAQGNKVAGPFLAEARCVVCGREATVRAKSTSLAVKGLRVVCVKEGWKTVMLPKGMRGPRRRMVCRRCSGRMRPVSARAPAHKACAYDAW